MLADVILVHERQHVGFYVAECRQRLLDRQKSIALLSRNEQLFGGFLSIIDC